MLLSAINLCTNILSRGQFYTFIDKNFYLLIVGIVVMVLLIIIYIVTKIVVDRKEPLDQHYELLQESYSKLEKTSQKLLISEEELDKKYQEIEVQKQALRETRERYRLASEGAEVGLWDYEFSKDDLYISTKGQRIIGIDGKKVKITIDMLVNLITEDYVNIVKNAIKQHLIGQTELIDVQFKMKLIKDKSVWVSIRGRALFDENGKPLRVAGSISNINKEKIAEAQVIRLAYYDHLTQLPNRQLFEKEMSEIIEANQIKSFGLMFIDIDNLKAINDSLGYRQGDIVIKNVTEILNKYIGLDQSLYRFGGDEFIIISKDIMTIEQIEVYLTGLLKEFQKPFNIDGLGFSITLSIGVAIYPIDGDNLDFLLKHADTALNNIKQKGKNGYEIFSYEMHESLNERLRMERELRHAVTHNELELYYQPKIDINSRNIVGYEALVRWNHPIKGLIMPMEFIPLAEETGLIIPMGEWVIKEAVTQLKKWHNEGHDELTVSINLSAKQLKDVHLIEFFTNIITNSDIDPRLLELEITETTALYDINYAIAILTELKLLGVRVSLDDFGTGYSSLNYLTVLPIDTLKIDKTFLDKNNQKQNVEIIKSVIALAHACDMNVVAEGVETQEQLDFLVAEDCDLMQGFFFSKPLPFSEAIKLRNIIKP